MVQRQNANRGEKAQHTILLVESNKDDMELTLRALRKNNIREEVVVARDGIEALHVLFPPRTSTLASASPTPSVILLDMRTRRISPIKLLERVRADHRTRSTPVILLCSSDAEPDVLLASKFPSTRVVLKPVELEKYIRTIGDLNLPDIIASGKRRDR